ncbi:MAG: alpha/beta hydrolase [Clostridiaceae bacterium]|nr:alpha/beta hydrolase [Clostridiaceae bacterium]
MSVSIKTVKTDGFSMDYFTFGNGNKTFVILPGLSVQSVMGSADLIAQAYDVIASEFTVYVFDRRNELPDAYSVSDMAHDTAKAFEALGLEDVYLFGASQGGMIGLTMALEYPSLVAKLMLGSSCARITPGQAETIEKWIALAEQKDGVKLNLESSKDIYPAEFFEQYKNALEELGKGITDNDMERFVILASGTEGFDVTHRLGEIRCPVFAIGSSDDRVLSGATEELIRMFSDKPDFRYHLYSSYGHAAYDTAPDYKQRLLAFCNE